jgi:hypothetical protein
MPVAEGVTWPTRSTPQCPDRPGGVVAVLDNLLLRRTESDG